MPFSEEAKPWVASGDIPNDRVCKMELVMLAGDTYKIDWVNGLIDLGDGAGYVADARVARLGCYCTALTVEGNGAMNISLEEESTGSSRNLPSGPWQYGWDKDEYSNSILILKSGYDAVSVTPANNNIKHRIHLFATGRLT